MAHHLSRSTVLSNVPLAGALAGSPQSLSSMVTAMRPDGQYK